MPSSPGIRQLAKQGRIWVFTDASQQGLGKFASQSIQQNLNQHLHPNSSSPSDFDTSSRHAQSIM